MLYRKCPECGNQSLKIPIFSSSYVCRKCISIFKVPVWFKAILVVVSIFLFLALLQVLFHLLGNSALSLIEFGALIYLAVPLAVSALIKLISMYFGPLVLIGVKGKVRGNS